ncbi:Acylpyruvase FAHD1, mitochondrial-like [Oopsacas minuta]|uniref:Oxaloacetate tautomerase FAHD1, mitochondrial n=1 Tax=Oopsacas minuta TaxID=111878 RepID=A0AAV7JW88_9METZ|nr:Acylpyruvase FAHD1, mitochondrial-like [Oopsacas minuta]
MDVSKFVSLGRKIIGVGRNYKAHAAEMGYSHPTDPVLFLKPTSSYVTQGNPIIYPKLCSNLHHEVELGIVIGRKGKNIPIHDALSFIGGYVLAIDMTARDLQSAAKTKGNPWSIAKGMDTFCPVSPVLSVAVIPEPQNTAIWLKVNDKLVQNGCTKDMIFPIPDIISYVSARFTLEEHDVILTGTPEGVGPVEIGQKITAGIGDTFEMGFEVVEEK